MDRRNRSHPTLAPLTTTSPSTSYIYPTTSIPSTPSLLSRPTSRTRLRPTTSTPRAIPPSNSSSALHNHPSTTQQRKRNSSKTNSGDDNDEWITRTASALTLTRLEEKGQSWLAARHSSTSLTGGEVGDDEEDGAYQSPGWDRSGRSSYMGSRSRLQLGNPRSRRGSVGRQSLGRDGADAEEGKSKEEVMGPDFVDVDEEEEEGREGEDVDEGEMRKVVMGRVGGWVDWAVGWMDMRGEDVEDDGDEGVGEEGVAGTKGELDPVELQKRLRRKKRDEELEGGTSGVGKPPEGEQAGVWSDAKWLLGVAKKVAL